MVQAHVSRHCNTHVASLLRFQSWMATRAQGFALSAVCAGRLPSLFGMREPGERRRCGAGRAPPVRECCVRLGAPGGVPNRVTMHGQRCLDSDPKGSCRFCAFRGEPSLAMTRHAWAEKEVARPVCSGRCAGQRHTQGALGRSSFRRVGQLLWYGSLRVHVGRVGFPTVAATTNDHVLDKGH